MIDRSSRRVQLVGALLLVSFVTWLVWWFGHGWVPSRVSNQRGALVGTLVYEVHAGHLAIAAVAMGMSFVLLGVPRWRPAPVRLLRRVVAHPAGSPALVALFALVVGGLHGVLSMPVPNNPDELSNLLLADTLLHGRLTNPSPPFPANFETIGVLVEPTYASKYPPGQGALLALGTLLGHPWVGVWLSFASAAALVTWMVRRWFGPRLALAVGSVVAFHPGMQAYQDYWHGRVNFSWSHGYFGGALVLGASAVLLGVLARRRRTTGELFAFAAALGVLANTRPLEGLLVALPASALLFSDARREGRSLLGFVAPLATVLVPVGVFILYYNWRITGSVLQFPHREYARQYSAAAMFLFMEPNPFPEYANTKIFNFYANYQRPTFMEARADLLGSRLVEIRRILQFYAVPALVAVLFARGGSRRLRVAGIQVATLVAVGLCMMGWLPHYFAPAFPAVLLFVALGLERLLREGAWRSALATALVVVSLPVIALTFAPTAAVDWPAHRLKLQAQLEELGGKHLVVVGGLEAFHLWERNEADLENADVLWVIQRQPELELLEYYRDRTMWRLHGSVHRPRLRPLNREEAGLE